MEKEKKQKENGTIKRMIPIILDEVILNELEKINEFAWDSLKGKREAYRIAAEAVAKKYKEKGLDK